MRIFRPALLLALALQLAIQPARALDCLGGTAPNPVPVMIPAEQNVEYYNIRNASIFARQYNTVPDDQILVIGDSHTDSLHINRISSKAVPLGIAGDTWRGVLNRIGSYPATNPIRRAELCVLWIGINDTDYEGNNAYTNITYMVDLFDAWATGKWVIVLIPYVNETIANKPGLNARVASINAYIANKFANRPGFVAVDLNPSIAPAGQLDPAKTLPNDGVHLNAAGYTDAVEVIRAGIVSLGVVP